MRDDFLRYSIIRCKRSVFQVTDRVLAAVKIQIISKIFLTILELKITN